MAAESRLLPLPPLPPLTGAQTQMLASASAHKGSVASHPGGGDPKTMATGWLFDGGAGETCHCQWACSLLQIVLLTLSTLLTMVFPIFHPVFAPLGDGF